MNITFEDAKLGKIINDDKERLKKYGKINSKIIRRRLDDLASLSCLEEAKNLPGKYHNLTGDRSGEIAVHVEEPYRLIFTPDHDPIPLDPSGSIDWKQITKIKVIEIVNYHGK